MIEHHLQFRNQALYFLILFSSFFVFLMALGAVGIFNGDWTTQVFDLVCHQDLSRTFSYNGNFMAVCSRCIGIYGAFAFFWIIMPAIVYFLGNHKNKFGIRFLLIIIGIIFIDVIGNNLGFWSNTHFSRFLTGTLLGISAAVLLKNEFFRKIK